MEYKSKYTHLLSQDQIIELEALLHNNKELISQFKKLPTSEQLSKYKILMHNDINSKIQHSAGIRTGIEMILERFEYNITLDILKKELIDGLEAINEKVNKYEKEMEDFFKGSRGKEINQ